MATLYTPLFFLTTLYTIESQRIRLERTKRMESNFNRKHKIRVYSFINQFLSIMLSGHFRVTWFVDQCCFLAAGALLSTRNCTARDTVSRALMTSCSSPEVVSTELDGKTEELFDELIPSSVFTHTHTHTLYQYRFRFRPMFGGLRLGP